MPFGFGRSIFRGGAAPIEFGSIVDTQVATSRYVSGNQAFKFAGHDSSNNPIFLLAYHSTTRGNWYYRACKFTYSTSTWSFGTELSVGTNTNQRTNTCATNSTGYATWLAPSTASPLVCGGADMGGNAGTQDNIEVYRLEINTSTLALTAFTSPAPFNSGDVVVSNFHFAMDMVASNQLMIIKGGIFNNSYNQARRILLNSPATEAASDINGFGDFFWTGNIGFFSTFLGMPAQSGNGAGIFTTMANNTDFRADIMDNSTTTFYAINSTNTLSNNKDNSADVGHLCQVDDVDLFCQGHQDVSTNEVFLRLVNPAFQNPTGTPTVSSGTNTTISYNDGFSLCSGFNINEFYGANYNGTTLDIKKFTASGTTLSQGATQSFTLGATPSSSSGYEVEVYNSMTRCRDHTNGRNMIAGAYTDSSGNARVWGIKYLL